VATWRHHKDLADLSKLETLLRHKAIYIHRPLVIHERNSDQGRCGCCDSPYAIEVERREHIDLIIDPRTSTRILLQHLHTDEDRAEFHRLAAAAKRYDLPRRVSRKQLEAMECQAKVLAIFGGVRAGKTSFIADHIFDDALLHGGAGTQLWWVAPTLEKTEIGIRKLIEGETIGKGNTRREVAPLMPEEMIRYVPTSAKSERRYVQTVDGTKLHLKYAGKDGGNLKGDPPQGAVLDEGCEVDKRSNYGELVRRLMESDGRLLIATTPVAGHWLKDEVYDRGVPVSDWQPGDHVAWTHITCLDNPWVSERMIQETIATMNDAQEIRREIYGEWVGSGPLLWRHFDESAHIAAGDTGFRTPDDLGLIDVTRDAVDLFFMGQACDRYLGQDFNLHPMCSVEIQVAVHPLDPLKTPIVLIPDEVVEKVGTIYEHLDNLDRRGYSGAGISCDATGAQFNSYRLNHGIQDKNSTQALEMRRRGYLCQPCRISAGGSPANPSQLEKVAPLHRLMMERIKLSDGTLYPRILFAQRAHKTLISLRTQESDSRGNPMKEPNTLSDRISGPTDALCYGVYPLQSFLFSDSDQTVRFE
jgi:hypothetical protein